MGCDSAPDLVVLGVNGRFRVILPIQAAASAPFSMCGCSAS